jgi:hypothetical protein
MARGSEGRKPRGAVLRGAAYVVAVAMVTGCVTANLRGMSDSFVTATDLLAGIFSLVAVGERLGARIDRVGRRTGDYYDGLADGQSLSGAGGHSWRASVTRIDGAA